jgi:spore germination protein KC
MYGAVRRVLLSFVLICAMILPSGCWNYRETNEIAIVTGVSIDKNPENGNYLLTIEIVNPSISKGGSEQTDIVQMEGMTIFDAIRNVIMKLGRKLYWSHAKVVIISEDIAREGAIPALDFINRNTESRIDVWLLVSKDKTAGNILMGKDKFHETLGFHIDETMRNNKNISKFMPVELWLYLHDLYQDGISPVAPTTQLVAKGDEKVPLTEGMAVFKGDRMVGTLDGDDTMSMLFVRDQVKGGQIVVKDAAGEGEDVTIEIAKSKTEVKPVMEDGNIVMEINVDVDGDIDEITGTADLINDSGREELKAKAQKQLKKQIESAIKKVQRDYGSDIFGFGWAVERSMPGVWRSVKPHWEDVFVGLEARVNASIDFKGSILNRTPIKEGD